MIDKLQAMQPDRPVHPGLVLRELIKEKKITNVEAARRLRISRNWLQYIIRGRADHFTRPTAERIEKHFGVSADLLMTMKNTYEEWYKSSYVNKTAQSPSEWR